MLKKLSGTSLPMMSVDVSENKGHGLDALRNVYVEWRFRKDLDAILDSFERLSDHRLHMIGLRRENLFETVGDMMVRAAKDRAICREFVAKLDAPTDVAVKRIL